MHQVPPRLGQGLTGRGLVMAAIIGPLALLPAAAAIAQQPSAPVKLAPHRAVYDFVLGSTRTSNSISALSGRMVYEFTGSTCEGFTQTMRFVTRTTAQSGEAQLSDQRSTSWEDNAGVNYRFQSSQYRDQKLTDQTAGTAIRGQGEADTRIDLTHPDKRFTAIGGAALFPVQHSVQMIEAARRGRSNFKADFFDGSEGGEKTYVINAMIGRPVAASFNKSLKRVGQADKLDGIPAWPVALSYFEQGSERTDAVPVYEMSFLIFANGVSRRLVIDNGEYQMKGELSEFTLIDTPPCKK